MAGKQFDNEMRGVLFRQTEKTNERSPDYTGNVTINGVEYRLAGWAKQGRNGTFLSLAVSEQRAREGSADDFEAGVRPTPTGGARRDDSTRETGRRDTGFDEMDDDIPF